MSDLFLRACRGERVERIPAWCMRQAGRSLPGYRKLREKYGVLELTQTPELAAQVSLEPIERLGVDAAILFADIMLLPIALGVGVDIVEHVGPVIDSPIDTPEKIAALLAFDPTKIEFLAQTIRLLRQRLQVPLIGFSGAPFTLASYLIEGKPSRTWSKTKQFMLEHPTEWDSLMRTLAQAIVEYLRVQIVAGAQAVQLFDSWVGCLSPAQYQAHVLPHVQYIFSSLKAEGVPRIHFGTNTAGMLEYFADVDCEVIGVDWRITLKDAKTKVATKTLQGNLDPAVLLAPWESIAQSTTQMIEGIDTKRGYIFNLGHGVLPESNDAVLKKLIDYVHSL